MPIDPFLQLRLLLAAFFAGLALGVLSECGRVLRVLVGGHTPPFYMREVYARPLPILKTPVRLGEGSVPRRVRVRVLAFSFDFCFCLAFGICGILVQYRYHNGAFRAMVPLGMLGGFFLWRYLFARPGAPATAWLAYLLSAFLCYLKAFLLLPWQLFYHALRFLVVRLLLPQWRCLKGISERRVSRRLCRRQLEMAKMGLASKRAPRSYKIKEEKYVKRKKKRQLRVALDHSHPHCDPVLRVGSDRRRSLGGVSPKKQSRREHGAR